MRITEPSATRSFTKDGKGLGCACSNLCRTESDVCPWFQHSKRTIPPVAHATRRTRSLQPDEPWPTHSLHARSSSLHGRISASGHLNGETGASFHFPDAAGPSLIASAKHDYARLLEGLLKWRRDQLVCLPPRRDTISTALMLLLECIRPPSNNTTCVQKKKSACLRGD